MVNGKTGSRRAVEKINVLALIRKAVACRLKRECFRNFRVDDCCLSCPAGFSFDDRCDLSRPFCGMLSIEVRKKKATNAIALMARR
jgi:hypothetical protein